MPSKYAPARGAKAARLGLEHRNDYPSEWAAITGSSPAVPACRTARRALLDFGGQQSFQGDGQQQSFWGGLVQGRWQGFGGGVQFELGQV
jgi:hypothetical protein